MKKIPKIIWMYWDSGYESMPSLNKQCVESWKTYNKDWEFRLLDNSNLSEYFDTDNWKGVSRVQAKSDVLRINLLADNGGVWVDADVWCCKPLDEWVHDANSLGGFFAFYLPHTKRIISSWFLASTTDNYLTKKYRDSVREYWDGRNKSHAYYWFHYLFGPMCDSDEKVQTIWDSCDKVSGFQQAWFRSKKHFSGPASLTSDVYERLRTKKEFVYKLDRRSERRLECLLDVLNELMEGSV